MNKPWYLTINAELLLVLMASSSGNKDDKDTFLSGIEILDLSSMALEEIPSIIRDMPNLRTLNLSDNHISSIPEDFKFPGNLSTLFLHNNKFTTFSFTTFSTGALASIRLVDLSLNQLTDFPDKCYLAQDLIRLNLRDNNIHTLKGVKLPVSLRALNLDNNSISSLRYGGRELSKCLELSLSDNRLEGVPDRLFKGSLVYLDLSGNPINDWDFLPLAEESGVTVYS